MGQYWMPVNLDKREFIDPHKLATGLKLWEQLANAPGTPAALLILTAAMPEPRGGGDLQPHPAVGRWAGDRIAVVGDYAKDADLPNSPVPAGLIYGLCGEERRLRWIEHLRDPDASYGDHAKRAELADALESQPAWTDVSEMVCECIEKELGGKFTGEGWRDFSRAGQ